MFSLTTSLLMALPGIMVLLAARAVLGPSIWASMVIFGILMSPAFYRVVFGAVSGVRHELYVDAARVFGLSDARIIGRHILSVVRAPAIILAAGVTGIAIAIQAGLDFLGLGDLTKPSWGGMLNDAFANIYSNTAQPAVAQPGHRPDLHRARAARQRPARRARAQRLGAQAQAQGRRGRPAADRPRAGRRPRGDQRAGSGRAARCCWRSVTCRSATTSPTAR